jgi:TraM recognition site of TraD and TraG
MPFFDRLQSDSLDDTLMFWSPQDPFTVRHACQNSLIVGKTGSGKSSGSGAAMIEAFVGYPNSGGLWLASKPEDKAYAINLFRRAGRSDDLIIMEPGGAHRFNVLDYEMKRGAKTLQLTQLLLVLGETLDHMEAGGSGQGGFWKAKNREGLNHAIEIIVRATGALDSVAIEYFIDGAALKLEELDDAQWKQSYHAQALGNARANISSEIEQRDFEAAYLHWTSKWPKLNERTRSSVEAGLYSLLHVFNSGIVWDLLSRPTTVSPDDPEERIRGTTVSPDTLENRKWWFVNMPITPGDAPAVFVNAAVKLAFQRYVLARKPKPGDPLLVLWSDEFQNVANSYDRAYVEACRSHKACLVALTQSAHALYARMYGQGGGNHETNALLTNFGQVVVHTLGDATTAEHFSNILGRRREIFIGTSLQPDGEDLFDLIMGRSRVSVNASEHYEPALQPAVFLRGLRQGGPANGNLVDGVVIRSGQPFNASGGENYLITSFRQR